jgi:hypothetical protein
MPVSSRIVCGIALISAWGLSSCERPQAASNVSTPAQAVLLNAEDQPLREDFNRDQGFVRLLFVVDPRCPECLRGLADMGGKAAEGFAHQSLRRSRPGDRRQR